MLLGWVSVAKGTPESEALTEFTEQVELLKIEQRKWPQPLNSHLKGEKASNKICESAIKDRRFHLRDLKVMAAMVLARVNGRSRSNVRGLR